MLKKNVEQTYQDFLKGDKSEPFADREYVEECVAIYKELLNGGEGSAYTRALWDVMNELNSVEGVCSECGFEFSDGRDLNKFEHICKGGEIKRVSKMFKELTYKLFDNNGDIGKIQSNIPPHKIEKAVADYIKTDEDEYNIDDFVAYLKEKGYTAKSLMPDEEVYEEVYF